MKQDFKVSQTILDTMYGSFEFSCFCWGIHEEDNVLCVRNPTHDPTPLVRVQSACYTAEIFRSVDCDCHEQLDESLKRIAKEGGLLVYMLCDGRGAGLYHKVLGLDLGRTQGLDTSDAYRALGLQQDPREYDRVGVVLRHFGITGVRLLTNNPRKIKGLEAFGIAVTREPLEIPPTPASRPYLQTKHQKMGHLLTGVSQSN
jgi:GTP cyclohydrolase II